MSIPLVASKPSEQALKSPSGSTMFVTTSVAPAGLSAEEAGRRRAAEGPNELPAARERGLLRQACDVLKEPMLLLLAAAAIVNFLLSEPVDGSMLMASVVVVITISIYQEHKTENALAALRNLSSPRALVVRDGVEVRVAGRDVVRGDLVLLNEGDRVPADGRLLDAVNLSIDESALTGESVPVRKAAGGSDEGQGMGSPGGDGTPWVFSGTLVVKGRGAAVVQATAAGTELGRVGTALRTIEPQRTRLQREIDRIVRVVAVLGLAAAAFVVVAFGLTRHEWLQGLLAGIATAMSMLPEEFPVVLTVFLALGAWRMSQRHVLTRRSAVIETLGAATAICVDKTGTLTTNTMTVRSLIVDGSTYELDGELLAGQVAELVHYAALASSVDSLDPMDRAFRNLASSCPGGPTRSESGWQVVREYPLSEQLLALSQVWRSPDESNYLVAAKGAPEAVADLCHLQQEERAELTKQVDAATAAGQRVLAIARAEHDGRARLPDDQHDFNFGYLGLAGLWDPVRPGAAEAVAQCHRAGIRVIMITGDYPGTALAIAEKVGIDPAAGVITGRQLAAMSDEELADQVRTVTVFARMVPEQKLRLIRALKANGEIVAMTGDGVNDAPALRAADIGIAMGGRGTDVARESADLVILDDDFASIAGGVRQGRGIFDNLRKAMAYLIAVHVTIFGMALLPVFVPSWPLVLLPVQIAFLELIIDPACSIVFESEQIDPKVMDQPPRRAGAAVLGRRTLTLAVLQGVSMLTAVVAVYLWALLTDRSDELVRSATFTTLVIGNLALILVNRSWRHSAWYALRRRRNATLKWILIAATGLLVAVQTLPAFRRAFEFGPMSPSDWIVAMLGGLVGVAWFEWYKRHGSVRELSRSSSSER